MDSITQMALGAAVGEAVLGRRIGNRAPLWGAVLGTLPDLDVLIPLGDPVSDFTWHRSFSHSLIVLTLVAPLIAWLLSRRARGRMASFRLWWLMVFLVLITHPLLDGFTVYGTQLLWPIDATPVGWSSLFIIDPAYTLPLLIGVLGTIILARLRGPASLTGAGSTTSARLPASDNHAAAHDETGPQTTRHRRPWRLNAVGLVLSTLYIGWSLVAKFEVEAQARASLAAQGITYERLLSTPAPFNTLLWRLVIMDGDVWYEAFHSLLDGETQLQLSAHRTDNALLLPLADHWPVQRLEWFTHGFFRIEERDGEVRMTDLRMGLEPDYVFSFRVAVREGDLLRPVVPVQIITPIDTSRLGLVWDRIFDPTVKLAR